LSIRRDPAGNMISQKLVQIFFMNKQQVALAQRFVAGFVYVVNGTFNTDSLRLPLLITVGITNSGKTFLIAFSYCPSESKESYDFFFQSFKEEVFAGDI
jgi:MULE transposase domain